jgi:hypothetical protein
VMAHLNSHAPPKSLTIASSDVDNLCDAVMSQAHKRESCAVCVRRDTDEDSHVKNTRA